MKTLRSNLISMFLGGTVVAVLGSVSASASVIYDFQSVTPSGANFDWKYNARLSSDQKITATSTDYAVVYDFLGLQSASTSAVVGGLVVNTFLEDTTTPQPFLQNVPDDPTLMNVRTTISGTFTPAGDSVIYVIDIISTFGQQGQFAYQSAQALKNAPGTPSDGSLTGNSLLIEAPGNFGKTPEPTTMLLFGSGLLGLGLLRKRIKTNQLFTF